MFFAIAAVLAAAAAALPAPGQAPIAGHVVVSAKIHPRVLERAQSEPVIPVFVVLENQPQREILERVESVNALYQRVAESRHRQAAQQAFPDAERLRQAREAAEAVLLRTRQQAFQAIEQAIRPEQEALEGRLRALGATRISRYLGINMLTAEIPASAITAWPAGSAQPMVSTLNSFDGAVVANAAIMPAGAGGAIDVYVTDRTQVILDINGYFAP